MSSLSLSLVSLSLSIPTSMLVLLIIGPKCTLGASHVDVMSMSTADAGNFYDDDDETVMIIKSDGQIIKSMISSQFCRRAPRVRVTYCQLDALWGPAIPDDPGAPDWSSQWSYLGSARLNTAVNRPQISIHDIVVSFHLRR